MNDHDTSSAPTPAASARPDQRRRRFLGAGVSATPALLTLASSPALGVTCFSPSRSLSRNTSVSQQGQYGECTNAESPGNYSAQQDPLQGAYHWPAAIPPTTPFHPLFSGVNRRFYQADNTTSLTLGQVLMLGPDRDTQKVAFHLIGAYLNVNGGNGAIIPPQVLTSAAVLEIWNEWDVKGYYEPMAGIQWGAEQIKDYLVNNGIIKGPKV
jgi:hypothetical protein